MPICLMESRDGCGLDAPAVKAGRDEDQQWFAARTGRVFRVRAPVKAERLVFDPAGQVLVVSMPLGMRARFGISAAMPEEEIARLAMRTFRRAWATAHGQSGTA